MCAFSLVSEIWQSVCFVFCYFFVCFVFCFVLLLLFFDVCVCVCVCVSRKCVCVRATVPEHVSVAVFVRGDAHTCMRVPSPCVKCNCVVRADDVKRANVVHCENVCRRQEMCVFS